MNHDVRNVPRLVVLGPIAFAEIANLRRFLAIVRAYWSGAKSLHKAHQAILRHAAEWNVKIETVEVWERVRSAAFVSENLISRYHGVRTELFTRIGGNMPWIGLTDAAAEAYELVEEFIAWCDQADRAGVY